jgi:WD40 repeat protein
MSNICFKETFGEHWKPFKTALFESLHAKKSQLNGAFANDGLLSNADSITVHGLCEHIVSFNRPMVVGSVLSDHCGDIHCLIYDSETRTLFSSSGCPENTIKVWKAKAKHKDLVCMSTLYGHDDRIYSLAYDSATRTLYSGSADTTIKVWQQREGGEDESDNESLICVRTLEGHSSGVLCVVYDSTTRTLFSGSKDATIKVWRNNEGEGQGSVDTGNDDHNSASMTDVCTLEGHKSHVYSLSYDSTTRTLYSGSWDETIKVWTCGALASSGGIILAATVQGYSNDMNFSGREDGLMRGILCAKLCLAHDPANHTVYAGIHDGVIEILQTRSAESQRAELIPSKRVNAHNGSVRCLVYDTNSHMLYSGSADRIIKVWEINDYGTNLTCLYALKGHSHCVFCLAYDATTHTLFSGSKDKKINVWKMLRNFHDPNEELP